MDVEELVESLVVDAQVPVEQPKLVCEQGGAKRLTGDGAFAGGEQVGSQPVDEHVGRGAPAVTMAVAERLHAGDADPAGLLRGGVVGDEVQADVAVQAGEQVQRPGVVGVHDRS
jgi:hypothetical protein